MKVKINQRAKKKKSSSKPPIEEILLKRQPFSEHLQELRMRLLISVTTFILGSIAGYFIHDLVLQLLVKPLNQPLFYSSPAGGFDFVLKISLFVGFVVSLPIFVYEVLRFIEPVLPKKSPKVLFIAFLGSCLLLILGMGFAYFVSLPAALHFLSLFATNDIKALISTNEYFSFITRYLVGFGVLFQLPLIMLVINSFYRITTKQLMSYQKWVVLISFIIAGILTPTPDFFNQLIMAVPLILLYELTIVLLYFVNKKTVVC